MRTPIITATGTIMDTIITRMTSIMTTRHAHMITAIIMQFMRMRKRHQGNQPISLRTLFASHDHHHDAGEVCSTCGHSHAPDPKMLSGDRFDWRTAWSAVAAVGIRPCSGALIVLTFAFLNGLWLGGLLSVFAMAVGTAITVSVLATIAVTAKNWAVAMAGDGRAGNRIHAAIEIAGAGFVFVIGLLLLTASLNA
jgi:ABC-type nickel/cobalt efflux system permease component RcnA